ncbi:MAG: endonuclease/exonuclease/phosphatase family protein [Chitinophagaceae bacterium]|nr:endonuclease/exonuclease/phosphatase family protein [Chitinophagaceae bacterium]
MPGTIRSFSKGLLIFCNVVVSVCMLLLYAVPYINQQLSWFINLFALLLPFFVLLQIVFFIFWMMVKRRLAWIPVLTLLLCWDLLGSMFGLHPEVKNTTPAADDLRVATWNTHLFNFFENNGKLDEVMLQKAKSFNADVLAVQELVFSLDSLSPISLERVKQRLGYTYAVAANDRAFGVYTNIKQKNERYHPFCVAIFSNYPVIRWKKIQSLKEYNHTFLWADVLVKTDTIRIFNIHLQSMHFAKNDYEFIEHIDQQNMGEMQNKGRSLMRKMKTAYLLRAEQAADVQTELSKSPYPVVVCGDMNDVPNSYAYQTVSKNLHDAYTEKGWGIGRTFQFLSPTLRIDYVLHSKSLALKQVQVVRPSPGDHNPVIADFILPKN